MNTTELKQLIEETLQKEVKKTIMEENSMEVYLIKNKDGEPIDQYDTEEEANSALEEYKKNHPDQELIIEKGKKLSFEELDKLSEKIESMENMNETQHKGHFTADQVKMLANKATKTVAECGNELMELCEMGDKIPAGDVFEVLDKHNMDDLKGKIKVKSVEATEGNAFTGALAKAKEDGDDSFKVDGKEFDVEESNSPVAEEEECTECGDGQMEEEAEYCDACDRVKSECVCESGSEMNESKKSIRLTESELVELIKKMVNEAVPGMETYNAAHKASGKENSDALSDVEKKIKDYLNFDGNDNPEFPNQIGGEVKARKADEAEQDEVADHRGGGLEDLVYDVDPSKEAQDRHEKALKGDTTMGNSQDAANVIPSKLGEKIIKKVKRKDKEEAEAPMYAKDAQPVKIVKEAEEEKNVISEEISRMKAMAKYNEKTQ